MNGVNKFTLRKSFGKTFKNNFNILLIQNDLRSVNLELASYRFYGRMALNET